MYSSRYGVYCGSATCMDEAGNPYPYTFFLRWNKYVIERYASNHRFSKYFKMMFKGKTCTFKYDKYKQEHILIDAEKEVFDYNEKLYKS